MQGKRAVAADGKNVAYMAAVMSKSEMKHMADIAMKKHNVVSQNICQ